MCGFAGSLQAPGEGAEALAAIAARMADTLLHRGPDDAGTWVDAAAGIALGHRRLSIIDLSAHGHQPMVSPSGRLVLAYNGEIYNHGELRRTLEVDGVSFRGTSDTEVLLAVLERHGLARGLALLNGMFAFALWDRSTRRLALARDRFGEKPLYYGWSNGHFLFGSELKALRAHPRFEADVDRRVLGLYLRHNCVPAPHCIFEGFRKLPPGSWLEIDLDAGTASLPSPTPYWRLRDLVDQGAAQRTRSDVEAAVNELEDVLGAAVVQRMRADVPLGAFLSGGVDSSTIVALMQAHGSNPVKTFTIGFDDPAFDESASAAAVARHLGTDHVEMTVTPADALAVIPHLSALYDEPFADSSQIPTLLLSRLAREHVTVSLSGDAGDELFGGYNRYSWCDPIWRRLARVPRPLRRAAAGVLDVVPPRAWDSAFRRAEPVLPHRLRHRMPSNKVQKLAEVMPATGMADMHHILASHWKDPSRVVGIDSEAPSLFTHPDGWQELANPVERMMYLDTMTYLPDDILVKVDRATMAVSLEARVPFLDLGVAELAWRTPLDLKIRDGQSKWLLRQVLHKHVPRELIERPKMGFGIPLDQWLRGPLVEWAESLLSARRLGDEGFFDPAPVRAMWDEHRSGRRDWQYHLWDVLMFQAWRESIAPPRPG